MAAPRAREDDPADARAALLHALQAEVFGEAAYASMSWLGLRPARRRQLDALRRLETLTKQKLSGALRALGERPRERVLARLLGGAVGLAAAPLPWRVELWLLREALRRTVPTFERLHDRCSPLDPALAAFLLAHERAQLTFVERELAGDSATSLRAVLALL